MKNDRRMGENELLLIDIGNVYCGMSDDLTRTIPVSGRFTPEQRKIYEIVLSAQKAAIAIVKPGVTLAAPKEIAEIEKLMGDVPRGDTLESLGRREGD
jgi:Xaa-Pro aminopeptidase